MGEEKLKPRIEAAMTFGTHKRFGFEVPDEYACIKVTDREQLADHLELLVAAWPWYIHPPCGGSSLHIKDIASLPAKSVPCSCGRPGHYFILYTGEGKKERVDKPKLLDGNKLRY